MELFIRMQKNFGQISTNFQKEGIIKFLFKSFQRFAILLKLQKIGFEKSDESYVFFFLELAIFQQHFTPKLKQQTFLSF
jgi:hypothetical protein